MEITHEVLLELGFAEVPHRPNRYIYKMISGRLEIATGIFRFHGLSPAFFLLQDLRFILKLIDYQPDGTAAPFAVNSN